jgi:hypothetical protein
MPAAQAAALPPVVLAAKIAPVFNVTPLSMMSVSAAGNVMPLTI